MKQLIYGLPVIALRGTTILPEMIVHFDVSRTRSIKAVEAAMLKEQKVFLVTQKDPENENPGLLDLYKIGTVAYIKQVVKLPKDVLRVLVEGVSRRSFCAWNGRIRIWKDRWASSRKRTLKTTM